MKTVDKLVVISILKTALVTLLLCTLMMVSVKLFTNIDSFLQKNVPFLKVLELAFLYIPPSMIYTLAPSLLFASSFTFSQLSANNELICLYNATISKRRLVYPVVILGLIFSLFQLGFSEFVSVPAERQSGIVEAETIGSSSSKDNRNITLSDYDAGYVFHATMYQDRNKTAQGVAVVKLDENHDIKERIDSPSVTWDETEGSWVFHDARVTSVNSMTSVTMEKKGEYRDKSITLKPDMLRDNSSDINTMTIPVAVEFLKSIKKLDGTQYQSYAVDFAQRLFGTLTPLVMLFIACTINYTFKKNVLLFTIIMCISIAVIYYVVQMVTLILARQGVMSPAVGMLIPMLVIIAIAGLERLIFGRNS